MNTPNKPQVEQGITETPGSGASPQLGSLFSDQPVAPMPKEQLMPLVRRAPNAKIWTRVVLPVVLLFAGVGAIAWMAQYQPGGRRPVTSGTDPVAAVADNSDVLTFPFKIADWNPEQPDKAKKYIRELELGKAGFFPFEFINENETAVDLGIYNASCKCAEIYAAIYKNDEQRKKYMETDLKSGFEKADSLVEWSKLEFDKELQKFITVPPKAKGLVKVTWKGKTDPGQLDLDFVIWCRRSGSTQAHKKSDPFQVKVSYVPPVRYANIEEAKIDFGPIDANKSREHTFTCFSSTRDIEVKPDNSDKTIKVTVVPMTPQECMDLTADFFSTNRKYIVKSASKVTVTLFENNDGKQNDIGLFLKKVPIEISSGGEKIDAGLPSIRAGIRGPVYVGATDAGNLVDLKLFSAKRGATKKVTVMAPAGAKLSFVECDPGLLDLSVTLKEGTTVGTQTPWEMSVVSPPGRVPGPLVEDGVLVLDCQMPATGEGTPVTRRVRIPVYGTASNTD
jgi:hypothetical protein